ncbi:enoyl-CoA hydratase-related protein [Nocardioides sp. TF02-7]|uniref:enoyl-CoA hydratase/isomerase family protein n=1 Tax=Nocardioides sp. TF02-7 TaxID=2917724 RepID=UPI001F055DA7|nr:enoyl-CoA hydratase-related protein [Nocardioides sp. TF02-7]UMG91293.1 enoyl-CoA hydratase-related protein [Nocardioides sp. TF02-7]
MPSLETGTQQVGASLDDDGVLTVTLDRPGARNALSLEMLEGLAAAVEAARTRPAVRALLLTGAGPAFCAGGDVTLMAEGRSIFGEPDDPAGRTALQTELQRRTVVALHDLPKPTVAAVNGPAVGAGLALALACDVRLAASTATLMTGFGRVGLAGDFGCSWLLHRLAGPAVARELLYGSAPLRADEARDRGLVNHVHPAEELADRALRTARAFARVPAPAAQVIAETAALVPVLGFAEACDRDAELHVRLTATPEHRAAVEEALRTLRNR